ncbi:MAG: hypothetical protein EXS18_03630 [Verrucomicrobiae bacterium]|nr:hypothetical protein [Verrucomicrobiae bacterium]
MKFDFQLKPKTGIGFVAGATGCQLAVASATSSATRLISKLAPQSVAGADPNGPPALPKPSDWLTQLRPQIGRGRFRLATAVDSREVFCKRVSLPAANPDEVRQMLSLQIEKWSPLPMEEIVWSYEILGTEGGNSDVLLVVGTKENLIHRAAEFGDEFMPDLIDVDLMVLWRALRTKKLFVGKGHCAVLWIDLHSKTVKCMLLKASTPLVIEHLFIDESNPAAFSHELSVFLLGAEANYGIQQIEETFLFGSDEASMVLGHQAAAEFGIKVTPLTLTEDLSAATGLARRALENGETQVNLLPVDFVQRQQKKLFRQQARRVGFVVLAIYIVVLVLFTGVLAWRKFSIKRIDSELGTTKAEFDKARLLQAEVRFLDQKLDDRRSALEVLRVVTESMTEQLYLMNFAYKQQQSLDLRGVALNAPDVYTFIDKLQKSGLFTQVKPGAIKNNPARGSEVTFEISCTLPGAGAPPAPPTPSRGRP